jgi:hypothetical protein
MSSPVISLLHRLVFFPACVPSRTVHSNIMLVLIKLGGAPRGVEMPLIVDANCQHLDLLIADTPSVHKKNAILAFR